MVLFLLYQSIFSIFTLSLFTPLLKTVNSLEAKSKFEKNIPTFSYSRSVRGLQDLISADLQIAQVLSTNLHNLPNGSYLRKASEQYLEDHYRGNGWNFGTRHDFTKAQQAEVISKNPIASYRTIRRMVNLLPDLFWRATGIIEIPGKVSIDYLHRRAPDPTDLDQAMDGILHLHLIYDFDIEAFSNGNISGMLTGAKLDAVHCHEIGLYGMGKGGFHAQVIDLLELALNKVTLHGDTTIDKGVIVPLFWEAVNAHDDALQDDRSDESAFYLFDTPIEYLLETGDISNRRKRPAPTNVVVGPGPNIHFKKGRNLLVCQFLDFYNLCRGANFQSSEKKSKLFCWLEYKAHPRFLIGPMKMEFLAMNPDVVHIYDVVNEKMIQKLKDVSADTMALATVSNKDGEAQISMGRNSESSWIDHQVHGEDLESLKLFMGHLTNLDMNKINSSAHLLIASYTFSGFFIPHFDATRRSEWYGMLIGTFMIYLSDVEVGGYTAFPHLGVAAKPIKGSAVFWHNTLRSEQTDYLTLHGACPVVVGHKYVASQWMHYYNQFLTHKCSQDPLERFNVAVNKNVKIISGV